MASSVPGLPTSGVLLPAVSDADAGIRLHAAGDAWVLLAGRSARIRINGEPLSLGCRVLQDRDELVSGRERSYYSTERLLRAEPFPDAEAAVFCARCKLRITPGTLAVRCQCGTWCHEMEDRRCWSYAATCPLCPQPTDADAGYNWEPAL